MGDDECRFTSFLRVGLLPQVDINVHCWFSWLSCCGLTYSLTVKLLWWWGNRLPCRRCFFVRRRSWLMKIEHTIFLPTQGFDQSLRFRFIELGTKHNCDLSEVRFAEVTGTKASCSLHNSSWAPPSGGCAMALERFWHRRRVWLWWVSFWDRGWRTKMGTLSRIRDQRSVGRRLSVRRRRKGGGSRWDRWRRQGGDFFLVKDLSLSLSLWSIYSLRSQTDPTKEFCGNCYPSQPSTFNQNKVRRGNVIFNPSRRIEIS